MLCLGLLAWRDLPAYFVTWPRDAEVNSIYRDDLQQLAAYTQAHQAQHVLVSSLEPIADDPTIYRYYAPHGDSAWFDGRVSVLLSEQPTLLAVSAYVPLSPAHARWLSPALGTETLSPVRRQDGAVAFDLYRLATDGGAALRAELARHARFPVYPRFADQPPPEVIAAGGVLCQCGLAIGSSYLPWISRRPHSPAKANRWMG
ncbi:MAG: hypothetical protein HC915_11650 [Anaerolineae bacterium]|nr:hypothetical protein [Anaerolineae bacterium]